MEAITGSLLLLVKCLFFLAHVSGSNSFPQPLEPEEEEYHLKRYAEGCEESRNILIEHNLRLVAHIVKKYNNTGKELDDLISIGTIGLIKAINTYNMEKKTRLATYAARCIENEILMTIRASKKTKGEVSLQDPIGVDKEGNEITLIDILGTDPDSVIDQVELKLQIKKMYKKMQAILKDAQFHPVKDTVLHLDFLHVFEDAPVIIELPVRLSGLAAGVKAGGKLSLDSRKLKVRALVAKLPEELIVNVEKLKIGKSIYYVLEGVIETTFGFSAIKVRSW